MFFNAGFPVLTIFQDDLEARKSLKASFLQPKLQLSILQNIFFLFEVRKCLKAFLSSVSLRQTWYYWSRHGLKS